MTLTKKLRESVVRAEIAALQKRIDELPHTQMRVLRARVNYVKQDLARLEDKARKWGLL